MLNNFRYADLLFFAHLDERIEDKGKVDHKTCDAVSSALKIGEPTFISAKYKKADALWRKIVFYTSQQ